MLHCDIVFIMGKPRLFTTDHVSGYCTFTILESKSAAHLQKAFEEVINAYQGYLKVVRYISVDAESVLHRLASSSLIVEECAYYQGFLGNMRSMQREL